MKITLNIGLLLTLFLAKSTIIHAQHENEYLSYPQPIPVEIVVGNNSTVYQSVIDKQLFKSKFNFYNLTNFEMGYNDTIPNRYFVQSTISYELTRGLRIGIGGNLQTYTSFKPIVALTYSIFTENFGFLIQPSIEIDKKGVFELYSLIEWTAKNEHKIKPYFKVSGYISRYSKHAYSYHNWRLGINYKNFRVGPAINIQYQGENAFRDVNIGGFVSILILE